MILAATFMIFGLVTYEEIKLHRPSSRITNSIHSSLIHLIFVSEVGTSEGGNLGKLGCDM